MSVKSTYTRERQQRFSSFGGCLVQSQRGWTSGCCRAIVLERTVVVSGEVSHGDESSKKRSDSRPRFCKFYDCFHIHSDRGKVCTRRLSSEQNSTQDIFEISLQTLVLCRTSKLSDAKFPKEFSFLSLKIVFFLKFRLAASSEGLKELFSL